MYPHSRPSKASYLRPQDKTHSQCLNKLLHSWFYHNRSTLHKIHSHRNQQCHCKKWNYKNETHHKIYKHRASIKVQITHYKSCKMIHRAEPRIRQSSSYFLKILHIVVSWIKTTQLHSLMLKQLSKPNQQNYIAIQFPQPEFESLSKTNTQW